MDVAAEVAGRAQGLLGRVARPRFPGSPGERECARLIRGELAAAGLDVQEDIFPTGRLDVALRRLLGTAGLAGLLGAWYLSALRPLVSALICAGLLAAVLLSGRLWLFLASRLRFRQAGQSSNLVAARPGGTPGLYLCAHYDSKSQALPLVLRLVLQLALIACLALLAALLTLGGALPVWPLFWLAAGAALVAAWQPEGNRSPGALDNGAAVALLLALAPHLPPSVGLVFFGAEEIGLLGSLDFGRRHPEARGAVMANLDGIGLAGRLRLFGGRGALGARIERAAGRAGVRLSRSPLWPGLLMDHVALRHHGLAAASLGCTGRPMARVHSAADTPELVEGQGLREAAAVLISLWQVRAPAPGDRLVDGKGNVGVLPRRNQATPSRTFRRGAARAMRFTGDVSLPPTPRRQRRRGDGPTYRVFGSHRQSCGASPGPCGPAPPAARGNGPTRQVSGNHKPRRGASLARGGSPPVRPALGCRGAHRPGGNAAGSRPPLDRSTRLGGCRGPSPARAART